MWSRNVRLAFFFAVVFGASSALYAQLTSGSLVGTVVDPSGAVMANCKVSAANAGTGVVRNTQTDNAGVYSLPSLPPGRYHVSVTASGFGTQQTEIDVALNQTLRQDFTLSLSQATQNVEVNASATVLQTESHEVSTIIGHETLENLPTPNRDVFGALQIAPNVQSYANSNGNSDIDFFGTGANSLTIGGTVYGNTSYLQDGVTNYNLLTKTANLQPSPESVNETNIQANGASARYDEPAVVNVLTRGGSNQFHGTLYDYLRNDALDARSYFSQSKSKYRYNQFGADLGGPILRNKLFFFFSYDGLRNNGGLGSNSAATYLEVVPTAAERAGDFSANKTIIYDPATYNAATGAITPFAGNQVPSNRISSFASSYLKYYPLPNGTYQGGNNYLVNVTPTTTYDSYLGRLDYNIGPKDLIYGAIIKTNPTTVAPTWANPLFDAESTQLATNGYVQETHTFGSTLVNVARFGYNESNIFETERGAGAQNYTQQFGIPYVNPAPLQELPPVVQLAGYGSFGTAFAPDGAVQKLYQYSDELNKVLGKHTIYF